MRSLSFSNVTKSPAEAESTLKTKEAEVAPGLSMEPAIV
jgi:hypothetical protein